MISGGADSSPFLFTRKKKYRYSITLDFSRLLWRSTSLTLQTKKTQRQRTFFQRSGENSMNRKVTKETEMLRKARLKKRLSQQQVATLAGVHIRQYQWIEYGERPMGSINMRFGLAVCAILEINPFDLVSFTADGWELIPQDEEHIMG